MKQKRKYELASVSVVRLSSASQLLASSESEISPTSSNARLVAMGSAGSLE